MSTYAAARATPAFLTYATRTLSDFARCWASDLGDFDARGFCATARPAATSVCAAAVAFPPRPPPRSAAPTVNLGVAINWHPRRRGGGRATWRASCNVAQAMSGAFAASPDGGSNGGVGRRRWAARGDVNSDARGAIDVRPRRHGATAATHPGKKLDPTRCQATWIVWPRSHANSMWPRFPLWCLQWAVGMGRTCARGPRHCDRTHARPHPSHSRGREAAASSVLRRAARGP